MLTEKQLAVMTGEEAALVVQELWDDLDEERTEHAENDDYFRGRHPLRFASAAWQEYHQERYKGFSDNWCQVIPTTLAERLDVIGWSLDPVETDLDPVGAEAGERMLRQAWRRNWMESQSSQGILSSAISACSTVLVWGDPATQLATITWKPATQGYLETVDGQPWRRLAYLDTWCEDGVEYADLFTAAHLWKFSRPEGTRVRVIDGRTESGILLPASFALTTARDGGWKPRQDDGDATWPLRNPMGVVPAVEVPNRPMLGGEPISEIAGAKKMQDAINLLWAYLFAAADHASMPARVVMGSEPPKLPILDVNGVKVGDQPVDLKELAQKRILWLTSPKASIGQWDAAKLDVFTDVMKQALRHLSSQTRTPLHALAGEITNVNGETVVALDAGLISKAKEFATHATAPLRELAALVAIAEGQPRLGEACRLGGVKWKDPEIRLAAQAADAALKDKSIGLSMQTILITRYGMTQAEALEEIARIEAEQNDPMLSKAFDAIAAARKTGQQAVPGQPGGSPVPAGAAGGQGAGA